MKTDHVENYMMMNIIIHSSLNIVR